MTRVLEACHTPNRQLKVTYSLAVTGYPGDCHTPSEQIKSPPPCGEIILLYNIIHFHCFYLIFFLRTLTYFKILCFERLSLSPFGDRQSHSWHFQYYVATVHINRSYIFYIKTQNPCKLVLMSFYIFYNDELHQKSSRSVLSSVIF